MFSGSIEVEHWLNMGYLCATVGAKKHWREGKVGHEMGQILAFMENDI